MKTIETNGIAVASFALRIAFGTNLLGQGIVRMGKHYGVFREWIQTLFSQTPIPSFVVNTIGYHISPLALVLDVLNLNGRNTKSSLVPYRLIPF
ncbi:hypothetical protein [Leptospira bouyouniensis]|uniref:hypothetical protein n=1 Tax=Leptospira bouyouniensis TaxID=2484911 RepID=UPI001091186F|nr:hypothetical protein [Leptospira bouyouniensis]TGM80848.1 hypothetical protein EHQ99_14490 [Leptospira bouyouniensis]